MLSFYIDQVIWFSTQEGTTRCSKNYFFNPVSCFTNQTLKNGGVFGVNRNNGDFFFNRTTHYDITGNYKGFFICQCNGLTIINCFQCWLQSCITNNGCQHK